jgi:hypothetical protein
MKKHSAGSTGEKIRSNNIPDIDIVDLEIAGTDLTDNISDTSDADDNKDFSGQNDSKKSKKSIFFRIVNMHTVFVLVIVVFVLAIFFKFKNWGVTIDQEELSKGGAGTYDDTLDQILPLMDSVGNIVEQDISSIVFFGNAPFADDRGSDDNIVSMIADAADVEVYNCSISGSYLSSQRFDFNEDTDPIDAYSFYWLATLMTSGANSDYYERAKEGLGDKTPAEADEVYNILTTVDFNNVDAAVIMYDASDYMIGRYMYNDSNSTDVTCFTGNLEAGIELIKEYYPNMRIIVMSPTYAYAVVNGKYVSSDKYSIGNLDVLSTYVIKEFASASEQGVTFVDNLYGTITEDNADEYLTDNIHLNIAGRRLVAERLLYALNYYNK